MLFFFVFPRGRGGGPWRTLPYICIYIYIYIYILHKQKCLRLVSVLLSFLSVAILAQAVFVVVFVVTVTNCLVPNRLSIVSISITMMGARRAVVVACVSLALGASPMRRASINTDGAVDNDAADVPSTRKHGLELVEISIDGVASDADVGSGSSDDAKKAGASSQDDVAMVALEQTADTWMFFVLFVPFAVGPPLVPTNISWV